MQSNTKVIQSHANASYGFEDVPSNVVFKAVNRLKQVRKVQRNVGKFAQIKANIDYYLFSRIMQRKEE